MDLRKKESGILAPFVLKVMDIMHRLHMYPENMYSVPALKMQKIRNPGKLITIKGKKIEKKAQSNPDFLSAFLSWVFHLLDTFFLLVK